MAQPDHPDHGQRGRSRGFYLRLRLEGIPELFTKGKVWEPSEKSHAPKADWTYLERKASIAANYTWEEWMRASVSSRARAIAHFLEDGLRESYAAEASAKAAKEKEKGKKAGTRTWESASREYQRYSQVEIPDMPPK